MFGRIAKSTLPIGKHYDLSKHVIGAISAGLTLCISLHLQAASAPTNIELITEDFPPLQIQIDNEPKGYVIEFIQALVKEAAQQQPMKIKDVHFVPWRRAIKMSQDGPNKLFFSITRNAQRENKYHWIGPVSPYEVVVYKHKDGPTLEPTRLDQLKPYRLAVQAGGSLDTYFTKQGFTPVRVSYTRQSIKMLRASHLDYAPQVNSFLYRIEEFGYNPDDFVPVIKVDDLSKQLWLAASPETSAEVVQALQDAYIKLSEINLLDDLIRTYTPDSQVMLDYRLQKRLKSQL